MTPNERALFQAILDSPDDDAPRLVYADWLEEHGQADRAEFIRVQCEIARLSESDPRRTALEARSMQLEKEHAQTWGQPLRQALDRPRQRQLSRWAFRRGFIEAISLTPRRDSFLSEAPSLGDYPLQELSLTGGLLGIDIALAEVSQADHLRCLRVLDLCGWGPPPPEPLRLLGSSPHLPRLIGLRLSLTLSASVLEGLAGTPLAGRLRSLSFDIAEGETAGVLSVFENPPGFPTLSSLGLLTCELGDTGLARLAASPLALGLRELSLIDRTLGPQGLLALLGSPLWGRLTTLWLDHCPLGDAGGQHLVSALPGSGLRRLCVAYAGVTTTTVAALVALPTWGELRDLSLDGNELEEAGVVALAGSPHLAGLTRLNLYSCGLTDGGALALARSPYAEGLREVIVYESALSLGARRALRKRFGRAFRFGL